MSSISGTGSQVSLQQFVSDHPGVEGLAKLMQSKGLTDAQIVAMLAQTQNKQGGFENLGQLMVALPEPGDTKSPASVSQSLGNLGSVELHADIFSFMALFQKMAQEMRQTARLDRETQLQAQVSTLQAAADQIKEAAQQRFNAAIASGVAQIGSGLVQIGGAGMSAGKLAGKGDIQVKTTAAGNWTTGSQGAGQMLQGVGQIVGGKFELAAGEADAQGKKLDAKAKIEEEARNKANDMMQQMMDVIRDIREKLGAIEQSNVEANRGIARNI